MALCVSGRTCLYPLVNPCSSNGTGIGGYEEENEKMVLVRSIIYAVGDMVPHR
jgi:hypothetical protein